MTTDGGRPEDGTLAEGLRGAFTLFGALVLTGLCVTLLFAALDGFLLEPERARREVMLESENRALEAVLSGEIALRGYLSTYDARHLEAYSQSDARRTLANASLAQMVGSEPGLAAAMLGKRLAEERWRERWAKVTSEATPATLASTTEGEALFDDYRAAEGTFAELLRQSGRAASLRARYLVLSGVLLELLLFMAALALAARQRYALEDSIVRPVMLLLQNIGRIRDGRLEGTVAPVAPRELRQLGEGLNDMAHALELARDQAASRDELVRQHSVHLRQILDASREFSESLNLAYVIRAVRERTTAIGGYERTVVWLMDEQQKRLVDSERPPNLALASTAIGSDQSLAGRAIKSGRIAFEVSRDQPPLEDGQLGPVSAIATPLIVGARVVGALEVRNHGERTATREMIDVLETLAVHAATALESARLHGVIEERSQVDPLTRLLNRRRLDEDLDVECQRCLRYSRPLAFMMLDVDHFKSFNDDHGHPSGDLALQAVAEIIASCMRTTDTAYRYGGEEFCVILRETSGLDAMHFAERVRQSIEQRFQLGEPSGLTASSGVADFSADRPTPHELVAAADAAMYESKHSGRNRVSLSSRPPFALNGGFEAQGADPATPS